MLIAAAKGLCVKFDVKMLFDTLAKGVALLEVCTNKHAGIISWTEPLPHVNEKVWRYACKSSEQIKCESTFAAYRVQQHFCYCFIAPKTPK